MVLVNGLPGAGKTTLANELAQALPALLICKDVIKEAVADVVAEVPSEALGRAAAEMMWTLAAAVPGTVLLESWWFKPRDLAFVQAGLRRCATPRVVEVWCDVPPRLARQRIVARRRHPVHGDEHRLDESWADWISVAAPLGLGRTLRVSTERPVDVAGLARQVSAALA